MDGKPALPTLKERIVLLEDELSLATRWNAAAILLAVYRSEIVHQQAATALRRALRRQANSVMNLTVTPEDHDLAVRLREHPEWGAYIFFITGLERGSGRGYSNAYRALNMHREYLIDLHVRCVFWMTQGEFRKLPRLAPDFWAFRHKVVEFPDLPDVQPPGSRHPGEDLASALHKARLALKAAPDNASAQKQLARLFEAAGCYEEALPHYKKAVKIAPQDAGAWQALARLYRLMGKEKKPSSVRAQL